MATDLDQMIEDYSFKQGEFNTLEALEKAYEVAKAGQLVTGIAGPSTFSRWLAEQIATATIADLQSVLAENEGWNELEPDRMMHLVRQAKDNLEVGMDNLGSRIADEAVRLEEQADQEDAVQKARDYYQDLGEGLINAVEVELESTADIFDHLVPRANELGIDPGVLAQYLTDAQHARDQALEFYQEVQDAYARGDLAALQDAIKNLEQAAADAEKAADAARDFQDQSAASPDSPLPLGDALEDPLSSVPDDFQDAIDFRPVTANRDPLILDLDGDGFETIAENGYAGVLFDHNGDGVKTASGWLRSDDGFLAIDLNGNGTIDSGLELFGENSIDADTPESDGFSVLAAFDTNGDKVIDANDADFEKLRIWRDYNRDGISQAGELTDLASIGIQSLGVTSSRVNQNLGNGNSIVRRGTFTRTDGSTGAMGDLMVRESAYQREFTDTVEIPAELRSSPNIRGTGRVRDLREAIALDESGLLRNLVNQYAEASTREEQLSIIDDLIVAWASTANYDVTEGTHTEWITAWQAEHTYTVTLNFDGVTAGSSEEAALRSKLETVEAFTGSRFRTQQDLFGTTAARVGTDFEPESTPSVRVFFHAGESIDRSYNSLREYVYRALSLETRLEPYFDLLEVDFTGGVITVDFSAMEAGLTAAIDADLAKGIIDTTELIRLLGADSSAWNGMAFLGEQIKNRTIPPEVIPTLAEAGIQVVTYKWGSTVYAGDGGTVLISQSAGDVLNGGAGGDLLIGAAGNDTLNGGAGDDVLDGGTGNDLLRGGDGNDVYIFGRGYGSDAINQYVGVSTADTVGEKDVVQFSAGIAKEDLTFRRSSLDLIITVNGTSDALVVNGYFENNFSSVWLVDEFRFADGTVMTLADVKTQVLTGTSSSDTIDGFNGDDTISGLGGDDILHGRNGNDTVDGGAGADSLFGDAGNDTLLGGDGNDKLNGGTGADTMIGGAGNDVYTVDNTGDTVSELAGEGTDTVKSSVSFTLGDNIEKLTLTGKTSISGVGNALNNTLVGNSGNNVLVGGRGNDTLNGGAGNDRYVFDRGDGKDTIKQNDAASTDDRLVLGNDIGKDQVWFQQSGSNLLVKVIGTNDQVTVKNWYSGSSYRVDAIQSASGDLLLEAQVQQLVDAMAAFSPPPLGQLDLTAEQSAALDSVIASSWQTGT